MAKKLLFILLLSIFTISLFGCGGSGVPKPNSGEYLDITAEKVQELMGSEKNLLILDVRTPEEFQSGHIPGAKNIPLDTLEANVSQLDKNQTTIVVCLSGERSGLASRYLAQNGFTSIYNMTGGMSVWKGNIEQ